MYLTLARVDSYLLFSIQKYCTDTRKQRRKKMSINDDKKPNIAVAAVAAPAASQKKKYKKREPIFENKFSFTDENMPRAKHILGKKYDRRYDTKVPGLCVHLRPSGVKTFYAFKSVNMYNKKKNKWAPNVVYKKMFHWAKNTGFTCEDARDKVAEYLEKITESRTVTGDEVTIEYLTRKFIKTGMEGFKISDETRMYKPGVKKHFTQMLTSYVLLENCTEMTKKKMTAPVEYQNRIYNKPLKEYKAAELTEHDIRALKWKLRDTPQAYNSIHALVSVVYTWARQNRLYTGENPWLLVKRYPKVKIRKKIPDDKRDMIKEYCESKAWYYRPHFLTIVAMVLYTGCRGEEMYGLRWEEPRTEEEKLMCSGWLEKGWENLNEKTHIFLWDPKNRKEFRPYIRKPLKELLIRLRKRLYEDQKISWCLESPYIFPKTRWSAQYPKEHTDANAISYPLRELNELFGLTYETESGKLKNLFTMKIGRKTFVSQVAKEQGVEIASRAVNHSDTKVTREHYIVPEQEDLEFELEENRSNVSNIEQHRIEKLKEVK